MDNGDTVDSGGGCVSGFLDSVPGATVLPAGVTPPRPTSPRSHKRVFMWYSLLSYSLHE